MDTSPANPVCGDDSTFPDAPASLEDAPAPPLPSADRTARRRQALSPHLEAFDGWCAAQVSGGDVPHFVTLDGHLIELGAWERQVLRQPESTQGRTSELLREGVAYQVRCLELDQIFSHGPMPAPADLPAFLDRLVVDVAAGHAIVAELQVGVDRMVAEGQLAAAKSLAAFRAKVVRHVGELADHLGAAEQEEASRLAREWVPVPPTLRSGPRPSTPAGLQEDAPGTPSWATYGGRPTPAAAPPWLEELGVEPLDPDRAKGESPRRFRSNRPVELSIERFSHLEAVRGITARPPSLFVVVDPSAWHAATVAERVGLLEELGGIASEADYRGVHVRTTQGRAVGQWLAEGGARLAPPAPGAS
jgi:hypothetical protein